MNATQVENHEATITLNDSQKEVLGVFVEYGNLFDRELVQIARDENTQQSDSGLRTRRNELVKASLVEEKDYEIINGRRHKVWGLV